MGRLKRNSSRMALRVTFSHRNTRHSPAAAIRNTAVPMFPTTVARTYPLTPRSNTTRNRMLHATVRSVLRMP